MQTNAWCFTLNSPTQLLDFNVDAPEGKVRYAIYQHEIGESGNEHFQGYVEFYRSIRLGGVRKIFPGAHWEPRRGTREQARDYCRKQDGTYLDGPYEFGTWDLTPGKRNDIDGLKKFVDNGGSLLDVWNVYPDLFLKYNKAIQQVKSLTVTKRTWVTELIVLFGETGTGKSSYVRDHHPETYWKQRSQWWDNYEAQEIVCLDDFYGWIQFDELLRLADGNPLLVQTKGGQAQFVAKKIYITTNLQPYEWYQNEKVKLHFPALYRRISAIYHFTQFKEFKIYNSYNEFNSAINHL